MDGSNHGSLQLCYPSCTYIDSKSNLMAADVTVVPALVLYRYLRAELSLGEAAELLGQDHDGFLRWLTALGVPTLRPMAAEWDAAERANADALLAALNAERR